MEKQIEACMRSKSIQNVCSAVMCKVRMLFHRAELIRISKNVVAKKINEKPGYSFFHKPISSKHLIPIDLSSVSPDELRMLADCGVGMSKLKPDEMRKIADFIDTR